MSRRRSAAHLTVDVISGGKTPQANSQATTPRPTYSSTHVDRTVVNTQRWRQRIIVIFVGLPARGKSYLAYKVVNFFRWKGFSAELFNVGKYRRQQKEEEEFHDASFFDAKNEGASQERERLAMCVLRQMLDWLRDGNGSIAVFDATNTTRARRQAIVNVCNKEGSGNLPVVFVESICDDPVVLHENYRIKVSKSPDYKGMQEKEALADLKKRVAMYEKVYEPIKETEELSYIKIRNLRAQLVINNIFGRLPQLLCVFLMSLHVVRRPIYLCRAGSSDNVVDTTPYYDLVRIIQAQHKKRREEKKAEGKQSTAADSPSSFSSSSSTPSSSSSSSSSFSSSSSGATSNSNKASTSTPQQPPKPRMPRSWSIDQSSGLTATPSSPELRAEVDWDSVLRVYKSSLTCEFKLNAKGLSFADKLHQFVSPRARLFQAASQTATSSKGEGKRSSVKTAKSPALARSATFIGGGKSTGKPPLAVYTSTYARSIESAAPLAEDAVVYEEMSSLNAMDMGAFAYMRLSEVQNLYPAELENWYKSRYRYRLPGAESYQDLALALEPLVMELERQVCPCVVISHSSTLQVLYGYFLGLQRHPDDYYKNKIELHTVVELLPSAYGWEENRFSLEGDEVKLISSASIGASHYIASAVSTSED